MVMKEKSSIELSVNPENGIERVLDIYKKLLEISDGNMDQYVNEDLFNIGNSPLEKYSEELQEFMDTVSKLCVSQQSEILMNKLKDISQNYRCSVFLKWLNEYAETTADVVRETLFIQNIDVCKFEKMAAFCMENYILVNAGEYAEQNDWNKDQLRILKNIIYTAAELRITMNFSEKYAEEIMCEKLYIDAKYSRVILHMVDQNYERLWRVIFIRKQKSIDEKLDQILRKQF